MTLDQVTDLINNVGFPIVVSMALFYQMFKTQQTHMQTLNEFKTIIEHNTESIDNMAEMVNEMRTISRDLKGERVKIEKAVKEVDKNV